MGVGAADSRRCVCVCVCVFVWYIQCSAMQRVAVCCSVLQCAEGVAVRYSVLLCGIRHIV